jgi:hypothetical protein
LVAQIEFTEWTPDGSSETFKVCWVEGELKTNHTNTPMMIYEHALKQEVGTLMVKSELNHGRHAVP